MLPTLSGFFVTYVSVRLPNTGHKLLSGILSVVFWKQLAEIDFIPVFMFWQSVVACLISFSYVAWNFTSVLCCMLSTKVI